MLMLKAYLKFVLVLVIYCLLLFLFTGCGYFDKLVAKTCSNDLSCNFGETCRGSYCQPKDCSSDTPCKAGFVCKSGSCYGRESITAAEYLASLPEAYCKWLFRCCSSRVRESIKPKTEADCISTASDIFNSSSFVDIRMAILNDDNFEGEIAYQLLKKDFPSCKSKIDPLQTITLFLPFFPKIEVGKSCKPSQSKIAICESHNCVNNYCVARGSSVGDPCSTSNTQYYGLKPCGNNLFCQGDKCVSKLSYDETCQDHYQCRSGVCASQENNSLKKCTGSPEDAVCRGGFPID